MSYHKFNLNKDNKYFNLRPICTESSKPGLSLKPGLKLEKVLKSYAYHKT